MRLDRYELDDAIRLKIRQYVDHYSLVTLRKLGGADIELRTCLRSLTWLVLDKSHFEMPCKDFKVLRLQKFPRSSSDFFSDSPFAHADFGDSNDGPELLPSDPLFSQSVLILSRQESLPLLPPPERALMTDQVQLIDV